MARTAIAKTEAVSQLATLPERVAVVETKGNLVGFSTDEIIRLWRFDFTTDRDSLYESNGDAVGCLKQDFHLVPYISGLDEMMDQRYAVFNTQDPGKNIAFYKK